MSVPFIPTNTKLYVPPPGRGQSLTWPVQFPKAALLDTDQEHSEVQREDVTAEKPTARTGQ